MWIGIDIGATSVKAGLVGDDNQVTALQTRPVDGRRSPEAMVELLTELVSELGGSDADTRGIGLAAPGVIDRQRGIIRQSPNFPDWHDLALGAVLSAETGLGVILENDANAVTWAEYRLGAGRGAGAMICLTLGTGVGGGMILNGALWRGVRGMAAELGHVSVATDGRACGCGNQDCLEQYVGAVGIRRTLREQGGSYGDLAASSDAPRQLAALARSGDVIARDIFCGIGMCIGRAITTYLHVLDMDRVVIGGGIAASMDLFIEPLEETVRAQSYGAMTAGLSVLAGSLGTQAGILGAALVAREGLEPAR